MSKYVAAFVLGFRRSLAAPVPLLIRVLMFCVFLLIFAALWNPIMQARGGEIAGYNFLAIMWYLFGTEISVTAVRALAIGDIGDEISSGDITTAMLRPASVAGMRMAQEIGLSTVRYLATVTIGTLALLAMVGPPPSLIGYSLGIASAWLGILINIGFIHIVGGLAFWLKDARSGWFLYQKLVFLPGGMLLPLQFFPAGLTAVFLALPFAYVAYAPGRLASGHIEPGLLLVQLVWIAIMYTAAVALFTAGERKLEVSGG